MNLEQCKGVHCVDLGESFQTHIYLQNFVSMQPRTSPLKFADTPRYRQTVRGFRFTLQIGSCCHHQALQSGRPGLNTIKTSRAMLFNYWLGTPPSVSWQRRPEPILVYSKLISIRLTGEWFQFEIID